MKITVTKNYQIKLEEVFDPVVLEASSGQKMSVCMRDHGFEIEYGGRFYSLNKGEIKQL
jgi:hypothetical protein